MSNIKELLAKLPELTDEEKLNLMKQWSTDWFAKSGTPEAETAAYFINAYLDWLQQKFDEMENAAMSDLMQMHKDEFPGGVQ